MSGKTVCVLTPNGRRQTVKCTPNTTILQIIEEVCTKHGFKAEDYDIKHHNKVLDTTTTIRFSGLPNNAQLELATATKTRLESDVILAVTFENGSRVLGNFQPNDDLLKVLRNLCPESVSPEQNPVVIYTRREIYGEALAETTLRSLGLTGGRAMIRLIHKSPEELKTQANVSAPLPSKPIEEKPYHRTLIKSDEAEETITKPPERRSPSPVSPPPEDEVKDTKTKRTQKNNTVDLVKLAREKKKVEGSVVKAREAGNNKNTKVKTEEVKKVPECKCKHMEVDGVCKNCAGKCGHKGPRHVEEDFVFLGKRNAMLFSFETAQAVPSEDLPDDFFELTIEDAKKILADVKRKRFEMDNCALKTAALRELENTKGQLRRLNTYKKAIIRVQFPDRTVLQGSFLPTDTVGDVLEFVREYLENKTLDFYIYSTPPKCVLSNTNRLIEIGCVPGALLHFGTTSKAEEFLRKDLRNKFTTNSMASMAAAKMRREATRCLGVQADNMNDVEMVDDSQVNVGASTSAGPARDQEYTGRKITSSTENVPKWFKP